MARAAPDDDRPLGGASVVDRPDVRRFRVAFVGVGDLEWWRLLDVTIATVAAMAAVAISEEVTFRGYVLQSLGERWPLWAATVGSGLVFAAVASAGRIRDGRAMPRGHSSAFERRRVPDERLPSIELMPVLRHRTPMHGLFEVDVTLPRALLREQREATGQAWSFTAFLITCLARAIAENPHVQGFRSGRRIVVFHEVDVATLVEGGNGQSRAPVVHIVRDTASRSVADNHDEIRAAQRDRSLVPGCASSSSRHTESTAAQRRGAGRLGRIREGSNGCDGRQGP
jgi:pyruvate/2-oxoglutarate dehydrogenase complex dihydrolipoamide acyltransferase (E2) component